jgi:putative flippase GtrA
MNAQSATRATRMPLNAQLARFGIIGAFTVSLDLGLLYVLVSIVHINYLLSAFVSSITATALNYLLSVQYVFLTGRFSRRLEFTVFLLTTGVGLGLNQLTMWTLVGLAGANYLFAKCVSLAVVTSWNFLSKKKLVFLD